MDRMEKRSPLAHLFFSYLNNRQIGYLQVVNTLESYHRLSNSILMAILVTGLIALMFSAIIGYMIARQIFTADQKSYRRYEKD